MLCPNSIINRVGNSPISIGSTGSRRYRELSMTKLLLSPALIGTCGGARLNLVGHWDEAEDQIYIMPSFSGSSSSYHISMLHDTQLGKQRRFFNPLLNKTYYRKITRNRHNGTVCPSAKFCRTELDTENVLYRPSCQGLRRHDKNEEPHLSCS